MQNCELYGTRALNVRLPPIEYRVLGDGTINIDRPYLGILRKTVGSSSEYSNLFYSFLVEQNALKDFIRECFRGVSLGSFTIEDMTPRPENWIISAFAWIKCTGNTSPAHWESLHKLWKATYKEESFQRNQ